MKPVHTSKTSTSERWLYGIAGLTGVVLTAAVYLLYHRGTVLVLDLATASSSLIWCL